MVDFFPNRGRDSGFAIFNPYAPSVPYLSEAEILEILIENSKSITLSSQRNFALKVWIYIIILNGIF